MADAAPLSEDPSAHLLRRWQEHGDRDALDELLRIEIAILKGRIRRRGAHADDPVASVSDVAQDVVLRFLNVEPEPRFDTPHALRAYLWTSAWRLLLQHLRHPKNATLRLDPTQTGRLDDALHTTGGLRGVEEHDRAVALDVAVHLLEPAEREILDLCYFREGGIAAAATQLGLSHDAAKMRLVRARKSLAKKLVRWTEVIG